MSRAHPLRVADYLRHILEAIGNIQDYTAGMDLGAFLANRAERSASAQGANYSTLALVCFHFDSW